MTQERSRSPLAELRAIRRSGVGPAAAQVRELLANIVDPLDLEAAGGLLSGDVERTALAAVDGFRTQRIALLGSSNHDMVPNLLTALLVRDGVVPTVGAAGFNQWRFEVMSGGPILRALDPRLIACLLDDEVVFGSIRDPLDIAAVEARCAAMSGELANWVDKCREICGGRVVLCSIPLSPLRLARIIDYRNKARVTAAWAAMNAAILRLAEEKPGVIVLTADMVAQPGNAIFAHDRMRHIAGQAFSPDFLHAYAAELARVARADLGLAKKCLVLDLDNTLWGGVLGDVGTAGLELGGAYPGSGHRELQTLARDLMTQGVLLTVCSKNDDAVAREAIANHPEMVLRGADFAAITANWGPKAENAREQAKALNIGLDALVFVDDHPVERDAMRNFAPQVATVELPDDVASYATTLALRGDFNLLELTEEDRSRASMYRSQSARAELQALSLSPEEYLASLDSKLIIEPVNSLNIRRVVQLFAKTNQFNLTGERYSEEMVLGSGMRFFGARLTDRFGDNGLIAAVALASADDGSWVIDNFVLSCRVFSRKVEDALIALIVAAAKDCAVPAVVGRFVKTAKNGRFADLYSTFGFVPDNGGFRHQCVEVPVFPGSINVPSGKEVFHA
jgi:FkbH-like protein